MRPFTLALVLLASATIASAEERPFEELHWTIAVQPGGAVAHLGDLRLAEGPARVTTATAALRLKLAGPADPPWTAIVPGATVADLPRRPDQRAFVLERADGARLEELALTPERIWRAFLRFARPEPDEPVPATSAVSLDELDRLARSLDSEADADVAVPLRQRAELELCPDLRRFPADAARLIDPYVDRPLPPIKALAVAPLRNALHAFLAHGDRTALSASWTPWRRHLAETRLVDREENITLCRLSRRVERLLAGKGPLAPADRLTALEALLLLARYYPIARD